MRLRSKLLPILAALLVTTVAGTLLAQVRIATVDLHRAIMDTNDGQRARRRLEGEFSNRQRELDQAQEELRRIQSELEAQRNVLSRQAWEQRAQEYQNRVIEVQRQFVEYQQELAEHEANLTRSIVERMQQILREIGAAESYTVILDTSTGAVVFSPDAIDLTQTLVQRYNALAPTVTGGDMDMGGDSAMEAGDSTMMTTTMMTAPMSSAMATSPMTP